MNKQPWRFNKSKILAHVEKILKDGGYVRVSNGRSTITIEVTENPDIWDADVYEGPELFSISNDIAQIDIDDGDIFELAKSLGGNPLTDEEIDRELEAIS